MKKYFLFLLFIVLFGNSGYAQRFRAGFTAGLVASDIDGADTRDNDNDFHKVGFTAGGLVNSKVGNKSTFQLELNFIQKGSTQPPDSNNNGYYKIAFSYIEIPVLIKRKIYFTIRKKPVNKIDLETGLSIGRMITRTIIGSS
ncbi:MAG: porin family protein, partial [Bacteroidia bacterium]